MAELESETPGSEAEHVASVRHYYEENTKRFVRFGQGKSSIHRAVWGPGATTRESAMRWVDELVVAELARMPDARTALDLGCGVGASLLHITQKANVSGVGVTLSPIQAERANQLFAGAGLATRVRAEVGDFHRLGAHLRDIDVAFAIEAFVQSASAERFLASTAGALRPGGRLLLCDDFLERTELSATEQRHVEDFRAGWRIGALMRVPELAALAEKQGLRLVENLDLTAYLELRRPRDIAIGLTLKLTALLKLESMYLSSLKGGDALQLALKSRALAYRVLVFERLAARAEGQG